MNDAKKLERARVFIDRMKKELKIDDNAVETCAECDLLPHGEDCDEDCLLRYVEAFDLDEDDGEPTVTEKIAAIVIKWLENDADGVDAMIAIKELLHIPDVEEKPTPVLPGVKLTVQPVKPIDVSAIVNEPTADQLERVQSMMTGIIGDFEKRAAERVFDMRPRPDSRGAGMPPGMNPPGAWPVGPGNTSIVKMVPHGNGHIMAVTVTAKVMDCFNCGNYTNPNIKEAANACDACGPPGYKNWRPV